MKRINMSKYGFIRWPEADFSDDGNRFYAYRVGKRIRVTKCTSNGNVYIGASIDGTKLPYEVYSGLPHYFALDKLNGVCIEALTDNDLTDLYEACLHYEKEYSEAEDNIQMPTLAEIGKQCIRIQAKANQELNDINACFNIFLAEKLTDYEWKTIRDYMLHIAARVRLYDTETFPQTIVGTARSIIFVSPDYHELKDSWYYTWIMEKINK